MVCVDKLTYAGNLSTRAPVMGIPNFRFCKLDICDRDGIYALFEEEKPDVVINFAAESHMDRSIENSSIFLQTNVIGTSVLMDACREIWECEIPSSIYRRGLWRFTTRPPRLFFTETTPIHTSSPYSSSKAGADLLVQEYHRTYRLPTTISRCSNN